MGSCNRSGKKTESMQHSAAAGRAFDQFVEDYYKEGLELDPMLATQYGIPGYNDRFPNTLSAEYRSKSRAYYRTFLEKAKSYRDGDLSPVQKISKETVIWECKTNLEGLSFRQDLLPIDQTWSVNNVIALYASGTSAQPFNTMEDYGDWLKRLDGYLDWMDTTLVKMKEGIELGYVLPKSLIVKIPPTLEPFTTDDREKNLFYYPLKNFPASFSGEEKAQLTRSYNDMITRRIIPAYRRLYEFVRTTYLDAGRESSGIDGIPEGDAYYRYLVRSQTSTDLSPDTLFEIGNREVARIMQEMEQVKVKLGFQGSLQSFFAYLRNDPELKPYSTPQEVLDHFDSIYGRIKPHLNKLFDRKPRAGFEIRRTAAFQESTTGPHYDPGSADGSRPGIFYVSIPDAGNYNVLYDESLFLHEAIPGHHYQISLTQENDRLPGFRKTLWINAYGEGWALYAESLGKALGLYVDPYQYFGSLDEEMHRAIRLVVDVGLHARGWTREQAIRYSLEHEAYDRQEITSEIERYMAFPGQALGYKAGQMKILELRRKAEKELGDRFDIRKFHDAVLETGCVPLTILEEIIDHWIETKKSP